MKKILLLDDYENSIDLISQTLDIHPKYFLHIKSEDDLNQLNDNDEMIYVIYNMWTYDEDVIKFLSHRQIKCMNARSKSIRDFIKDLDKYPSNNDPKQFSINRLKEISIKENNILLYSLINRYEINNKKQPIDWFRYLEDCLIKLCKEVGGRGIDGNQ